MVFSIPNPSHSRKVLPIPIPDIYTFEKPFPFPYSSRWLIPVPSHSHSRLDISFNCRIQLNIELNTSNCHVLTVEPIGNPIAIIFICDKYRIDQCIHLCRNYSLFSFKFDINGNFSQSIFQRFHSHGNRYHYHSHENPMEFPFPRGIPFPCT